MDAELENAKSFLQRAATGTATSIYDHLTNVITKLLDEESTCTPEGFEDLSRRVRSQEFEPDSSLKKAEPPASSVELAKAQSKLFKTQELTDEDEEPQAVPNLMEMAGHLQNADIGLGQEETFRIFLALRKLTEDHPVESVSFWGKIFGTEKNYIVAEAMYKEGEEPHAEEDEEPEADEQEDGEEDEDAPPKSKYKPPKKLPIEPYGTGTNKKAYFVCHEPGEEWVALPLARPDCIVASRSIRKLFTGNLESSVQTYPPFPGNEADYLRAQIARITAGTHISPMGYYTFEEEDDEEGRDDVIEDEEFESKPRAELMEPDLSGWVHHTQYILPQGRCKWVNPKDEEDEPPEDEDEEFDDEHDEPEPEVGPPLLTPLQNDDEVDGHPAWTPRLSCASMPAYAAVCMSSHKWPGAHAFCLERKFTNVYIGYGLPYQPSAYTPPSLPDPEPEYAGDDVTEALDPTREEEEEFEADQAEAEELEDEEDED